MPDTDKPYDVLEATLSLCPECMETIPAKIVREDGRVYLRKHCPRHGPQVELLEHDAAYFVQRNEFSRPGSGCKLQTERARGCPHDCGLCPEHEQHTCIGLIEVTGNCDLGCPVCYAAAGAAEHLPFADIRRMIDFYIESEHGRAEILQLSGGEPTSHPEILEIIRHARGSGLAYVMLNTNGLRLAEDAAFVHALGEFIGGFEIYLQFDGLSGSSCRALRGQDLVAKKLAAVEALGRHRIPTTLVMTVQSGVNDAEIGEVLAYAMRQPHVRGVNFQPAAFFGRRPAAAPRGERSTLTGILQRIERQTAGLIRSADFVPLPCDVDRVAVNFLYRAGTTYRPILRGVDCRKHLPHIRNTFNFRAEEFLQEAKTEITCCNVGELLQFFSPQFLLKSGPERVAYINENLFRLSVVSFVDAYNFDLKSMQKECVHVITPDFRKIPFSAYNLIHRDARARTPATAR
jgi:uncharacterized radical SAM superfamily Fe-S cluster-containing enzyme